MTRSTISTGPVSLSDLGALVTVQYPDRPDLALIAALRLLSMSGPLPDISVGYVQGVVLTRKARTMLRSTPLAATVSEGQRLSEVVEGEALLVGPNEPALVILGHGLLLDVTTMYLLEELGLPARMLHGVSQQSGVPDHLVVDFPYGLTGVYAIRRIDSPLAAAYRLMSRLGPMTRRRLEHDLQQLEPSWRQLRDTA